MDLLKFSQTLRVLANQVVGRQVKDVQRTQIANGS